MKFMTVRCAPRKHTQALSRPRSRVGRSAPKADCASVPTSVTLAPAMATRLRHLASHLHRLGERPLCEFLSEVIQSADPLERLEIYGRLDPDIVRALGADKLPKQLFIIEKEP